MGVVTALPPSLFVSTPGPCWRCSRTRVSTGPAGPGPYDFAESNKESSPIARLRFPTLPLRKFYSSSLIYFVVLAAVPRLFLPNGFGHAILRYYIGCITSDAVVNVLEASFESFDVLGSLSHAMKVLNPIVEYSTVCTLYRSKREPDNLLVPPSGKERRRRREAHNACSK